MAGRSTQLERWKRCAAGDWPDRRAVKSAASRCASLLIQKPDPAARRTDQPPRRRNHRLAATAPDRLQGHGPDRHPRPLLPRQHHRLDPRTRPRPRHPYEGNYSTWLEQKAKRLEQEAREDKARQKTLQRELEWINARAPSARRPSRRRASTSLTSCRKSSRNRKPGKAQIVIQVPAPGRQGDRGQEHLEGLRRQAADRKPGLHAAPGRHRRRHRPQRRGQVDAVQDDHRQGRARQRHDRMGDDRAISAMSTSPATISIRTTNVWEEISDGARHMKLSTRTSIVARLCRRVQLQGAGPAEEGRPAFGR